MDLVVRTDRSPDTLLASSGQVTADGVYRSADGGNTWFRTLNDPDSPEYPDLGRVSLAIAPSDQNTMYACAATNYDFGLLQIFRSTDGGATWAPRIEGAFDPKNNSWLLLTNPIIASQSRCAGESGSDPLFNQGWYDNVIAVAPHDKDVVFAGGIDLFRSKDGGAKWDVVSYWWNSPDPGYNHADHHALVFHPDWEGEPNEENPTANNTLFNGNDGGVWKSTNAMDRVSTDSTGGLCYYDDPGTTYPNDGTPSKVKWTSLNKGYNVTQFYHGMAYPAPSTALMGGTQDNGTPRGSSSGNPNGWSDISGGDGGYVFIHPTNTLKIFVEYTGKSMQRSVNGGAEFESADLRLTEDDSHFPFIAPFRADPQNPDRIWYGGYAPWRSSNAGSSSYAFAIQWTQAGVELSPGNSISAWAIAPKNSNHVFAGTEDGKIFGTIAATFSNAGTPWTNLSTGLPNNGFISWIEVDPNDASGNTMYATQSRYGRNKVFRTTTAGADGWTNITANLPDIPAHCIVVQPGRPSTLFLGTELGVFRSKDTGASWVSMNIGGFPAVPVETLQFQTTTSLYAFTHGRGAWRADVDATGGSELAAVSTDTLASSANWTEYLREPAAGDPGYGNLTSLDFDSSNTALRAHIDADPGTAGLPLFRAAGWRTTDAYSASVMPYASVGSTNYVRSKWYVYAGPASTATTTIPAVRMQVHNRFIVSTTLEVFAHQNDGANNGSGVTGDELGGEVAPSRDPAKPSLYRVDFDPVDVPYLVSNGVTEGIGRAFLAQGDLPQDKGFIALAESVIGVYPVGLVTSNTLQTLQPSANDAGSLKVTGVTPAGGVGGPAVLRFTYPFGLPGRIQNADFGTYPDFSEGSFGVTMDSANYDNQPDGFGNATRMGIALLGFYPGDDLAKRPRVEPGKQYKVRFHVTSTNQSNRQCQLRMQVNVGGGVYAQKLEIGGSVTSSSAARQTIAAQALPGIGTRNPDKYALEEQGGWYTLLLYTPLSKAVRPDAAGTLAERMPNWFTFAGPGVDDLAVSYGGPATPGALNRRDLRLYAVLLDTLSTGFNSGLLEKGNFTIDRIDVLSADAVEDGSPETLP